MTAYRHLRSTAELGGAQVYSGKRGTRRIGKVLRAVFFPDGLRVAGFMVKRPDILFMFKRSERFFAWDSFSLVDGKVFVPDDKSCWDGAALARLGLDWDEALIMQGMDVVDSGGNRVGRIDGADYDEATGQVVEFLLSTSASARALVGQMRVSAESVLKYSDSRLVLRGDAEVSATEGGLATKAGQTAAVVGNAVKTRADEVGVMVEEVAEKAGAAVVHAGHRAGKQLGKTKGMFAAFRDEYKKASKN